MNTQNFTEGKILSPLMKFALPVLAALFLQSLYGAVDLLIVGQFAATSDVSAVSTGSMLTQCTTLVFSSLSMGVTVLLGQYIGQKKIHEAGNIIGNAILLFLIITLVATVIFVSFAPSIARIMQAPEEAFAGTVSYLRICYGGLVFIIAFNVLGGIFRGIGDSKMPLITVAIACVVNIFGDLLLVAGFKMGVAGAAIATVAAQAISVILSILIIRKRSLPFVFNKSSIRWNGVYIKQILKIGLPMSFQDLLISISFLVIMAIVNSLGLTQSAGVGVAEKVTGFIMLVPSAYMQSLSAFVAQNFGAKKMERARKALWYAMGTSIVASLIMFSLAFFKGSLLASIFSKDADVIQMAADYLKAYAIDCLLTAEFFCFTGYFSGMGKTNFVMLQGIIGAFAVRIPVSFFMSRIPGVSLFYVGLATPASSFLQMILCILYYLYLRKKEKSALISQSSLS